MKTAVEWLIDELYKQGISLYTPELIAEANKLFENQIKDANEEGFHSGQSMAHNRTCSFESPKHYYNKTFNQQEKEKL
jgi:hypothetical protein